ncbi:MAG: ABC transporter substrate-binding protein [Candidatus Aminicenantes bacterium]|nr:ABC transporter substrate-binding protein [Candidatus Aminicenantes bacterium]
MNKRKLLTQLLALCLVFAIKPYYGGEISIKLNEPTSFTLNTANYSNLILFSLIYENFFYMQKDGAITTHVFKDYRYDPGSRTLVLTIKDNLSFSSGKPLAAKNIQMSLKVFLGANLFAASKLNRIIKNIRVEGAQTIIELLNDYPDIVAMLTVPELAVLAESEQSFSGPFYPEEWEKGKYLILKANPFYAGGRTFLDAVRVMFSDDALPDVFLSSPKSVKENYREFDSGIYQNIYLCFLQGDVGQNTKIALYTLLKKFNEASGFKYRELRTLTSDEESPVSIQIKTFSPQKTASILKSSDITLYILASLSYLEKDLTAFLKNSNLKIETLFIDDSQMMNFLNSSAIKYVLIDKIFQSKIPIEEKISRILKESSFNQFNVKYLRMLGELDEVKYSNSQDLLMEQIARISEAIINDGFIFPLFQKNYSLYIRKDWQATEIDYYGRPLFQKASKNSD